MVSIVLRPMSMTMTDRYTCRAIIECSLCGCVPASRTQCLHGRESLHMNSLTNVRGANEMVSYFEVAFRALNGKFNMKSDEERNE